jgi:hypothetical protein
MTLLVPYLLSVNTDRIKINTPIPNILYPVATHSLIVGGIKFMTLIFRKIFFFQKISLELIKRISYLI